MLTLRHAIELSVLGETGCSSPRGLSLDEQSLLATASDPHGLAYCTTATT